MVQLFQLAAMACHVTIATTETTVREEHLKTIQELILLASEFPEWYTYTLG